MDYNSDDDNDRNRVYKISKNRGKNSITNSKSCSFTITELEVWQIIELAR